MGCFLACFGFSQKRKRRKSPKRVLSGGQGHGSYYKPLDSDLTLKLDITENPSRSNSEFSDKGKESSILRIKKKVSFNLNVKAYEPLPNHDFPRYFLESEEEKCEENKEEKAKKSSYPANYRYQNYRESSDEEADIKLKENDDSDEEHHADSDRGYDSDNSYESEKRDNSGQEPKKLELDHKATRDRSEYVLSVLKPVENLSQWKAVKARAIKAENTQKPQRKENIASEQEQQKITLCRNYPIAKPSPFFEPNFDKPKPPMQHPAVDASLSNWLVS